MRAHSLPHPLTCSQQQQQNNKGEDNGSGLRWRLTHVSQLCPWVKAAEVHSKAKVRISICFSLFVWEPKRRRRLKEQTDVSSKPSISGSLLCFTLISSPLDIAYPLIFLPTIPTGTSIHLHTSETGSRQTEETKPHRQRDRDEEQLTEKTDKDRHAHTVAGTNKQEIGDRTAETE